MKPHPWMAALLIGLPCLLAAQQPAAAPPLDDVAARVVAHGNAHPDGQAAFSFDHGALRGDLKNLPIGVFDSGIGGLTVLQALLTVDAFHNDTLQPGPDGHPDFENERFIYLGDQANMPYGNYQAVGKVDYLRELILKDAVFLLGRRQRDTADAAPTLSKPPVKAIVIACNTATAYGLDDLRAALAAWNVPVSVVGVVEAGARGVNELGQARQTVAVLATTGTCNSQAYPKAIRAALGRAGKPAPTVIQQGCIGLAGAIEGDPAFVWPAQSGERPVPYASVPLDPAAAAIYGFEPTGLLGNAADIQTWKLNSAKNYARYDTATLVEAYRKAGGGKPIDTVVLGCTHFPLVEADLSQAFQRLRDWRSPEGALPYRDLIAEKIAFVNPAELTAKELFRELAKARLRLKAGERCVLERDTFYLSVPNPKSQEARLAANGGLETSYKYGRSPGKLAVEDTIVIRLTPRTLPDSSRPLVQEKLPAVWERMKP